MNRLRIRFKRGAELKFVSHLDLIRVWHRALRRAGVKLAFSEGFNPHPKLSLAAPLALGVTGEAELMDVYTVNPMAGVAFSQAVSPELPRGLEIVQTLAIPLEVPSLQAQVRFAEYAVTVASPGGEMLQSSLDRMLAVQSLPWQHQRDTGVKRYDLRRLVDGLWVIRADGGEAVIGMKLCCDSTGAGRPEQVTRALGLTEPLSIRRTRLILQAG